MRGASMAVKSIDISPEVAGLIHSALHEDLSAVGDVTTTFLIESTQRGEATIIARQPGLIAGLPVAGFVFQTVNSRLSIRNLVEDGARVSCSDKVATITGSLASILTAERTALNFLQRLSGIATLTAQYVEKVQGAPVRILDTRKTTPGLRTLEKYAVTVGGGFNHRYGLYDRILIKENHIAAAGGIHKAVAKIRENMKARGVQLKIEVETRNLDEVLEAVELNIDRIMFDNMTPKQVQESVRCVGSRVECEVSGGVNLDNVRKYAETGVDFISVGALTHSAKALDLSLLLTGQLRGKM